MLGVSYITYLVNFSDSVYYSMVGERTADFLGGANRTFTNGGVTSSYKKGSLGWFIAENI